VLALNLPWLLTPLFLTFRLRKEHPFAEESPEFSTQSLDAVQMTHG